MDVEVPMNDLRRFVLSEKPQLEKSFSRFISSGSYVLGENVRNFEAAWSDFQRAKHGVGVSDGTSGLALSLLYARATRPNASKVAMVANAGGYALTACDLAGLEPFYIDIGREGSMDLNRLQSELGTDFAAVVFTHLYGLITDLAELREVCSSLPTPPLIVEDASQAHGFTQSGRYAGEWGDLAVFSLYPTKNLGGLGDAGVITTNSTEIAEWVRTARNYGWTSRYHMGEATTMNARLDELQASFLLAFLPRLNARTKRRQEIAERYDLALSESTVVRPAIESSQNSVYHIYPILAASESHRDDARRLLASARCGSDVHFPIADTQQLAYLRKHNPQHVPKSPTLSESWCSQVFSVPIFPEMTETEIDQVVSALREM